MASAEVTVLGAGVFGLAAAWACLKQGAKVRVIDPNGPAAGASGGLVGALAPHAPEGWTEVKALQLQALLAAEAYWAEVGAAGGVAAGYLRSGRLQPLADAESVALARAREGSALTLWQGRAEWRVIAATGGAWEPHSPSGYLVYDSLTARISPRAACRALAAAITAQGGAILREGRAEGLVIHACGYQGLEALSQAFGRKLGSGQKGQAALLRHNVEALPQIYAGGLHVVPHADGTVAIGSTSENQWVCLGPDAQAQDLIARARDLLPVLEGAEVLETWAGIRPRAKSRAPLVGAWPGRQGHFIANGGFKIGFAMAPLIAEMVADLALSGRDQIPESFKPESLL